MHPIERLRYVARSAGGDPRTLVAETALGLCALGDNPAGLVVACRRLVERHPLSGPMWWLCAHMLTAADPKVVAQQLVDAIFEDPTPEILAEALPAGAGVCVVGWPEQAGDWLLVRDDVHVFDVKSSVDDPVALAAALRGADLVLVEALVATSTKILATQGSAAVAEAAAACGMPVWAVIGTGRCLPDAGFQSLVDAPADVVPLSLCSHRVSPAGLHRLGEGVLALAAECPLALELTKR
jgi:hypothetical protein